MTCFFWQDALHLQKHLYEHNGQRSCNWTAQGECEVCADRSVGIYRFCALTPKQQSGIWYYISKRASFTPSKQDNSSEVWSSPKHNSWVTTSWCEGFRQSDLQDRAIEDELHTWLEYVSYMYLHSVMCFVYIIIVLGIGSGRTLGVCASQCLLVSSASKLACWMSLHRLLHMNVYCSKALPLCTIILLVTQVSMHVCL